MITSFTTAIRTIFLSVMFFGSIVLQAYNPNNEKVIICGVGKNIAPFLSNMIGKIEALGKNFKDYTVIIYENNSTDQTVQFLKQWAKANQKVMIISENLSPEQLYNRTRGHALTNKAPCRMELIAYARNIVLEKAMSKDFGDFNFVIMTDLDFAKGWNVQEVLSSFTTLIEWDCIAAHSIYNDSYYYDRFAYRDCQYPLGPELLGEGFWTTPCRYPIYLNYRSGFKKVYSAFGGIALYRKEALKNCSYSGHVTKDLEKLMLEIINNKMDKGNCQYRLYKKIVGINNTELPIVFQANCGYDSPVVCEHSTLHASMILNGYDKIYVNPSMICSY